MIKKLSAFILLAVIVFGAYRGIATLNTSAKEIEKIDAKDIVDALVAESNGKTPKMINDEMRLESVKKNGLQITFLNTVVSASSNRLLKYSPTCGLPPLALALFFRQVSVS